VLSILVRVLQAVAGFFLFYGIEGMLSSAGLQPPNIVVLVALFVIVVLTAAAWRSERRPTGGLWVAGLVVALPLLLQSASPRSGPVCPPDHPPLTESYYCVAPGAPVILAISSVVLLLSLAGAVVELRGLMGRPQSAVRST
jgi:4-amino-4-deoxy-L-arabinose transferase-like glycosyltransferase